MSVKLPKDCPSTEEFADMVKGLLHKDPSKRYDLYTIKTHKWILLSDSAISLKVDIATQAYRREQERLKEEEEKRKDQQILANMMLAVNLNKDSSGHHVMSHHDEEEKHSPYHNSSYSYAKSPNLSVPSSSSASKRPRN